MKIIDRNVFNANQQIDCYVCRQPIKQGQNYEGIKTLEGDFNKHWRTEPMCKHTPDLTAAIKEYQES